MLKKLFKILHGRLKSGSQLKPAMDGVERIVRTRCPNLIMTRKNRDLMMDAVQTAMNHISGLIDQLPGPVACMPEKWDKDPVLNALFVDSDAIRETLQASRPLKNFFKQNPASRAVALLTAAWREKTVFGTAQEGQIVRRSVPQQAISFEDHKLIAPAADLTKARTTLQKEAIATLCQQMFVQTRDLKEWQAELKKQRDLLAFKVAPGNGRASGEAYAAEKQVLTAIDEKIESIQKELGTSEKNFEYMIRSVSRPWDLLQFETVSLRLSRLGIVLDSEPDSWANEFRLARYKIDQIPEQGAIWVTVNREDLEKA